MLPDWVKDYLTEEQQKAFEPHEQNANILAAAGSGKTRTLAYLVAADLASGIPAAKIIAFTFTEKAAEELLARIHLIAKKNVPEVDLTGMYVGTIHAWCLQYLMNQSDFYNVDPIDELQLDALVSRLYDSLALQSSYGEPYPSAIPRFLADLELFYNEHLDLSVIPPKIRPSIEAFLEILKQDRIMTFGTMIRDAVNHLREHGPVPSLRSLYVDEYQDVNPAQVELIRAMLPQGGQNTLTTVGDDLQCIYQWRGSDVARILNFKDEFAPASVFRLNSNFRARPAIVRVGNEIAKRVSFRDPEKTMIPARPESLVNAVQWFSFETEQDQAEAIVQIVQNFHKNKVPWNKIAVLLRSVRSSGRPITKAFDTSEIPYYCPTLSRGGQLITAFVIPLFDWFRAQRQEPKNEEEELEAEAVADALWLSAEPWVSVGDHAEDVFWDAITKWRKFIDEGRASAYDVRGRLYEFLDECGIRLSPDDDNLTVSLGIASQIIRSVEEIHRRRIAGQSRRTARGIMSEIYFALVRNHAKFGESLPIAPLGDRILVSTVHQAKGLEWPVTVIARLNEDRFPLPKSPHGTSFPDGIAARYGTDIDDERRLFYVAATRARERLFLLDSSSKEPLKRSTFLIELNDSAAIPLSQLSEVEGAVWKLAAQDLVGSATPPLRIGLSDVLLYLECPYQYGLRRVANLQPSVGDELGFGKGLHELIQRRFEAANAWTPEELSEQVERNVHVPLMSEKQAKNSRESIRKRIGALEKIGIFSDSVESEVDVEVIFEEGIVHGIVDGIRVNSDDSVHVTDWKSGIHEKLVPRYERQLQFYAYALRQQGRVVTGADLVDVGASTTKGMLVTRGVAVSELAVNDLVDTVRQGLRGISSNNFDPTPNEIACSGCDMRKVCAVRYEP